MTITYENPARRLSGKIAVVPAAGQGIGRAVAERFLAEGATVTYQTATPDPDQSQITVLTAPYHLRVVPRTARPVRFKKIP